MTEDKQSIPLSSWHRCPCCGSDTRTNKKMRKNRFRWFIACLVLLLGFGGFGFVLSFKESLRSSGPPSSQMGMGIGLAIGVSMATVTLAKMATLWHVKEDN